MFSGKMGMTLVEFGFEDRYDLLGGKGGRFVMFVITFFQRLRL